MLRRPLLKLVHFLLNYETNTEKLVQVVLFGQNELASRIDAIPELKSRMFPSALAALDAHDTDEMIAYRLTVAGAATNPFTSEATRAVFKRSLGLPRAICQICDMALLAGLSTKARLIDANAIASAASSLRLDSKEVAHAG